MYILHIYYEYVYNVYIIIDILYIKLVELLRGKMFKSQKCNHYLK